MKPELKSIEGGRAKRAAEIMLKMADPRGISEQEFQGIMMEFQEFFAPVKPRSNLSIVGNSCEPPTPPAKSG